MDNQLLQEIASDIRENKTRIENAKYLIELLRDTGSDTREQELMLKDLQKKQEKWEVALRQRGISIG